MLVYTVLFYGYFYLAVINLITNHFKASKFVFILGEHHVYMLIGMMMMILLIGMMMILLTLMMMGMRIKIIMIMLSIHNREIDSN